VIEIPHLARFHARILAQRASTAASHEDPATWVQDNVLIRGLGLGLHETFAFLFGNAPTREAFEAWIVERNGGAIDPARIARINAALDGKIADLGNDEPVEAVLSDDDLAFWDRNGYVVLHEAAPPDQLEAAERAIWEFLGMEADDPATWYGGARSIWVPLLQHPAIWANRRAPRIRSAFAQLWKRSDLWVTVDQAGMNPPETPSWRFPGPNLHFDVSLTAPVPFGVSGILYLTDTAADQGAFTCVPGFHKTVDAWLAGLPPGTDPRAFDLSQLDARHVAGSAGDLVIWHQALPHGSSPNRAKRPRLVQYISMSPSVWDVHAAWK
jgi:hypothetical protein